MTDRAWRVMRGYINETTGRQITVVSTNPHTTLDPEQFIDHAPNLYAREDQHHREEVLVR